ncbi:MAG: Na+/H+ antiporter subunit E [Clostridiales bacterium]|nr:Na+/H+ antiporter subunit E [Clostridiales bacterium]
MRKRSMILFVFLIVFWIVISTEVDLQHILVGIFLALITVWFWQDLGLRLPIILSTKELLLTGRCIVLLVGYIIEANIAVAKALLFSKHPTSPVIVIMHPDIKSNWGRVFLATCITITPGTVTIDINPDTGQFMVHALTKEAALGLPYWRMINEIKHLEKQIKGREDHVMDVSRTHDPDTTNTLAGDYRADSH